MQKKNFIILLCMFTVLGSYAKGLYDHLDTERMFLNDPDFYVPEFQCDEVLPNGIRLLYLETEGVIPRAHPQSKSREAYEFEESLNYMVLVVLKNEETGRTFRGLARKTPEGNYEPLYGKVGKNFEYRVFFNYKEDLSLKEFPKKIEGKWYLDHIYNLFEKDPNKRWQESHPGQTLRYPVWGALPARDFSFDPEITDFNVLFDTSAKWSYCTCYGEGNIHVPVREYGSTTITRGGKKFGKRDDTGGFDIYFEGSHKYPTQVKYDPEKGELTLTFGKRTVDKITVKRLGTPLLPDYYDETTLWVLKRDWERNPDKLFLVDQLNKWAQLTPVQLWGSITVSVSEYDDWLAVVGQKRGTDLVWYCIWPRTGYKKRTFDVNTRCLIADRLYKRNETRKAQSEWHASRKSRMNKHVENAVSVLNNDTIFNKLPDLILSFSHIRKIATDAKLGYPVRDLYEMAFENSKKEIGWDNVPFEIRRVFLSTFNSNSEEESTADAMARHFSDVDDVELIEFDAEGKLMNINVLRNGSLSVEKIPFVIEQNGNIRFLSSSFTNPLTSADTRLEDLRSRINGNAASLSKKSNKALEKEFKSDFKTVKNRPRTLAEYNKACDAASRIIKAQESVL